MKSYIKIPIRKTRSHKRYFQLLELMVAAFILLICIAPAMRIFTSMYQSQQEIIRENQRDHIAHLVHAKMTEMLYKRQLHIPEGDRGTFVSLSDPELDDQLRKFFYTCEASLVIVDSTTPRGQEYPNQYLARLVIKLKDVSPKTQKKEKTFENQDSVYTFYDYTIYIDAGKKASKDDDEKKDEGDTKEEDIKKKNGKSIPHPSDGKKTSPTQPPSSLTDTNEEDD